METGKLTIVRVNGGKTEFISEAKRRYWTHKNKFGFGGKRAEKSTFAVNTEQYG